MAERLTDQENVEMGMYRTPFEMDIIGGNRTEGDPLKPIIVNENPDNDRLLNEVREYRLEHPSLRGIIPVFDVKTNLVFLRNHLTPEVKFQEPDQNGDVKRVEIVIHDGDDVVDASDLPITLHQSKQSLMKLVKSDQGHLFIHPTDSYFPEAS